MKNEAAYAYGASLDPKDLADFLEGFIDCRLYGLRQIAEALALICLEKSEHVSVNWQDAKLAKYWEECSKAFDKTRTKL